VLVTGGTGAIGGHVARWVAGHGATRLVLASRRGPAAPGAASLAAAVAGAGASVQVAACDVAARPQLAGLLDQIAASGPPLTSVLHTAGALDDGVLDNLTTDRLAGVLAAKAAGAVHLDELTQDMDLDAFVLFSSISAIWGSGLLSAYAAANAFLDALAENRRSRGLAATSVAWGPWDGGGMNAEGEAQVRRIGLRMMDPDLAVRALAQVLDGGEAQVTVTDVDWARFTAAFTLRRPSPLIADLPEVRQALADSDADVPADGAALGASGGNAGLAEQLARADESERERLLRDLVRAEATVALGHESQDAVQMEFSFLELGFDSLTLVDFRNRLNAITGLRLLNSSFFECPTPELLARRLRTEFAAAGLQSGNDGPQHSDNIKYDMRRYIASDDVKRAQGAASVNSAITTHSLSGLYVRAARAGETEEIMRLIKGLAAFRPTFASQADLESVPAPVPISHGPAMPALICLASFFGRSGAQEYARFAGEFRDSREVSVVTEPGFVDGESLPASIDALVRVHAESIRRSVNGAPFVLAGHSTGGLVAHALATHLETAGTAPAAVVLIDTNAAQRADLPEKYQSAMLDVLLANAERWEGSGEDAWLTAMAHYSSLDLAALDETAIPTLLVRATEPMGGSSGTDEWRVHWKFSSNITAVDVQGDHFTMMGEHAESTARVVNEWLADL
jgi:thioesterase domain-containing protein/short-subunit dehydrogenase